MHDDVAAARASVRAAHVAWVAELTRLIALKITPNAITNRDNLDVIADALDEAALSLELTASSSSTSRSPASTPAWISGHRSMPTIPASDATPSRSRSAS